jgi:hypothetical protein
MRDDDLLEDERQELRDYRAWRQGQYDETPEEYWDYLDTSWAAFRKLTEQEEEV